MNTLPTKAPNTDVHEVEPTPTWRELRDRFRGLLQDILDEGKDLERELEPKVLPALRRLRDEVVKLIERIESRAAPKP